jgi:hypothetical protein
MSKLEAHMRDGRRQIDRDQYNITQQTMRLQAQQEVLDNERTHMLQQLSDERADIQKAKVQPLDESTQAIP